MTLRQATSLLLAIAGFAASCPAPAQDAGALRARHDSLESSLDTSPFGRPLVLESSDKPDQLIGNVYALVQQPFSDVQPNLQGAGPWCEILILHLNVKACRSAGAELAVIVGRKFDQPLANGYRVNFTYRLAAESANYLQVQLGAEDGPMGTSNYRIVLEAIPLDEQTTFMHMSYAYSYGTLAQLAMQSYLATIGSDKAGFTITGKTADGQPVYVGGVRGVLERNTMRYYLAIDAYLRHPNAPGNVPADARFADWFDSGERYARQLHEIDRADYLTMKRNEVLRQPAAP